MSSPVKSKKVIVECKSCGIDREVPPEKIPFACPGCRGLMYPRPNWEIKK